MNKLTKEKQQLVDEYLQHISDLKIYDNPKELQEFIGWNRRKAILEYRYLKMPPQSWCYCEVI